MPAPRMARMSLLLGVECGDVDLSAIGQSPENLTLFYSPGLVDDVKDGSADGALAAAAFAHDSEGFALLDVEVDTIDCPHDAFVGRVVDLQIIDLNYRIFC